MLERAAVRFSLSENRTSAAALDIGAKGSLACWFSSLTLLAASVAALLVYTVRRHRTDDYQGRYRVWLWAAGCWFLLATDQAASLREGFRDLMIGWTGTPCLRDGTFWWVVIYVLVFGAIGSRLLLDMRPSRLSFGALAAAAVAYGLALASHLGWTPMGTAAGEVMFRTGSEMAGHLMLLAAMGLTPAMSFSTRKGSCRIPRRGRRRSRTRTRQRIREGRGEGDFACRQPLASDRPAARRSAAGVSTSRSATGRRARGQACPHARPQSISRQPQTDQGRTQGPERAFAPRAAQANGNGRRRRSEQGVSTTCSLIADC